MTMPEGNFNLSWTGTLPSLLLLVQHADKEKSRRFAVSELCRMATIADAAQSMTEALALAAVALEQSAPKAAHYPEPNERHAAALAAVGEALAKAAAAGSKQEAQDA
jgi:hypothetical protein